MKVELQKIVHWERVDNTWVVFIPKTRVADCEKVMRVLVQRKDGTSSEEMLAAKVKGDEFGSYFSLQKKEKSSLTKRNICAECGHPGARYIDDEDGQLKHWGCCDIEPQGRYGN